MPTYASGTEVPVERSRTEIERTLARFGADQFGWVISPNSAQVGFVARSRQIRFTLKMPDRDDPSITRTETNRPRTRDARNRAYDQAVRSTWRNLVLVLKAKLAAVDAGILTFEEEFLPYTVVPGGQTVAEQALPAIERAYATGQASPLLAIEAS